MSERRLTRRVRRALLLLVASVAVAVLAAFAVAPDRVLLRSGKAKAKRRKQPVATFSHVEHDALRCFYCHPALFSSPRPHITHSAMKRGQYCGACHNGLFAPTQKQLGCKACHAK